MSLELEQRTVATAMHDPQATEVVALDPKWFGTRSYRAMFKAVTEKPTGDAGDWFRIAYKKYRFRGHVDDIINTRDAVINAKGDYLKMCARELKKEYLQRKISTLAAKYAQVGDAETLKAINDYSYKMQDLDVDSNADHKDKAVNKFIHDTKHPVPVGIKTYPQIDYVTSGGFYPGLFTIAAGTGVGKSAYIINLIYSIIRNHKNVRVDLFTLEMSAREELMRLISRDTGVSNYQLRNPYKRIDNEDVMSLVRHAAYKVQNDNLHIYDTARTLADITGLIKTNAAGRKPNTYIAFVDYLGLIKVDNSGRVKRYLEIGKITRTFKELTATLNFPLIQLAQLNRSVAMRDDKTPQLSDLRESASIELDSNVVFLMSQPKKNDSHIKIHVAKNRSGGSPTIMYYFNKPEMTFKELKNDDNSRQA